MRQAWNKMTYEEARKKALSYNEQIKILNIIRDDKNVLKFDILCPRCGKNKENLVTMGSIKNNNLLCGNCRIKAISEKNREVDMENSFFNNDRYNRLKYWDYKKNANLPINISRGTKDKYWFLCERNHSFESSICEINRGRWCPHCVNYLKESRMATTLKQVLKHEFPETIWEYDVGFRGFNGGISPYDIYVPELNLLIECQSEYHDNDDQKSLDFLKEDYAYKLGYDFISIDYRDCDVFKTITTFFPYIEKMPDYIDYTKNTIVSWDIDKAQDLLINSNLNQKEVAELVGATLSSFYEKVFRGILFVPKEKLVKTPVVRLTLDGVFVDKYESAIEYSKIGFNTSDICSCCKGNQHTHRGYLFMYEFDYNDKKDCFGNISLEMDYLKISIDSNKKEVFQLSLEGKFINKYNSITEASDETGFLISNISACCNKITKTCNGYIWMYKEEYDAKKNISGDVETKISYNYSTKKVVCIDKFMNFKIYESAREGEKETGVNFKKISYKCRNKSNKGDEYIWMLYDDFKDISNCTILTNNIINDYKNKKYKKKA